MKLKVFAKLNLTLAITGRREDGMHLLDMVMQNISLYDEMEIERAREISVDCGDLPVDEQNTALRAARLFFERSQIEGGATIRIAKRIPAQAGLGGGSADGAAVLCALNELYGEPLNKEVLQELGVCIGADVPFFIEGGCARARGIGEVLEPIENRCPFYYLLVKPHGGVPTGLAYQRFHELPKAHPNVQRVVNALKAGDRMAYFAAAGNALASAGMEICGGVRHAIADTEAVGADFAMMTGSGSCIFAVFQTKKGRHNAYNLLRKQHEFCAEVEAVMQPREYIAEP